MNCFRICSLFISLDPSLTIPCPHPPSDNHTEQTAQGSQRGQTFSPPKHCTCFSLYLGLSSWSLLPGLSSWKPFQPLPPTPCTWLCQPLPSHCLLRARGTFCVNPWGSHGSRTGIIDLIALVWRWCLTQVLRECLWRKRNLSWAPVLSSLKTRWGKLNEFFMSDFDWWL